MVTVTLFYVNLYMYFLITKEVQLQKRFLVVKKIWFRVLF